MSSEATLHHTFLVALSLVIKLHHDLVGQKLDDSEARLQLEFIARSLRAMAAFKVSRLLKPDEEQYYVHIAFANSRELELAHEPDRRLYTGSKRGTLPSLVDAIRHVRKSLIPVKLSSFERKTYADDLCPICTESLIYVDLARTECGHVFCMECLWKAININVGCPMCRSLTFVIPMSHRELLPKPKRKMKLKDEKPSKALSAV